MTEVDEIDREWTKYLGKRPTAAAVGRQLGVSAQGVRYHRWRIERFNKRYPPTYDLHVQAWRHWMYENFRAVLPLIRAGAREFARSRKPPVDPDARKEYHRQYAQRRREEERKLREQDEAAYAKGRARWIAEINERHRKEREFPPPPDPFDSSCMLRGSELYDRLRQWRGIPKIDPAAELRRWNRR